MLSDGPVHIFSRTRLSWVKIWRRAESIYSLSCQAYVPTTVPFPQACQKANQNIQCVPEKAEQNLYVKKTFLFNYKLSLFLGHIAEHSRY